MTAQGRNVRTDQELQDASNHLYYEFWMLKSLANALVSGIAAQGWLANALLESFVIHCRGLIEFFYPQHPRHDDVIAADYISLSMKWEEIRPDLSEVLSTAKRRSNKELAHLTYERLKVTLETKTWPFTEIKDEIKSVIEVFLEHVPKHRLGSLWHYQEKNK